MTSDNWKISAEELLEILNKIISTESENRDKITWKTGIFYWLDKTVLLTKLRDHKIGILESEPWKVIIPEGKWDCEYFFLLLKGSLGVYKNDNWITDIEELSVVWEMWFLWESWRTATVIAKDRCYLLPLDRAFLESLPQEEQTKIYRNLTIELIRKLVAMNDQGVNFGYWEKDISSIQWKILSKTKSIIDELII